MAAKPKITKPSKPGLYNPYRRPTPTIKDTPIEKIKPPKGK